MMIAKHFGKTMRLVALFGAMTLSTLYMSSQALAASNIDTKNKIDDLRLNNGHYVEVAPNVEIFYIDKGQGTPIVFVPGWSFTADAFVNQIEHFSKKYRVIAIDPRSHGYSTQVASGNDYPTHGKDLASVINKLNLKKVVLAGWSFGNFDTWEYVHQNGLNNVKAVVMIDNRPKTILDGKVGGLASQVTNNMKNQEEYRKFIKMFADNKLLTHKTSSNEELDLLSGKAQRLPYAAARDLYVSGWFGDREDTVKEIGKKRPTLMVLSMDRVEPTATWMKANSPKTEIKTLGKHMMFWEFPKEFNQFLDDFLQKNNL